jgi:hypothetical protein
LAAASLAAPILLAQFASVARADAVGCTLPALSQPFLPWLDAAYYELVPGGDFENGTWKLSDNGARVPGSEPYAVTGKLGNWSLSLPLGSSAQSPSVCVAVSDPTVRFFIAGYGAVQVDFVYGDTVISSGIVVGGGKWMPTQVMLTGSAVDALPTSRGQMTVKLTGLSGAPVVDDVFVDPWNRG